MIFIYSGRKRLLKDKELSLELTGIKSGRNEKFRGIGLGFRNVMNKTDTSSVASTEEICLGQNSCLPLWVSVGNPVHC